MLPMQLRRLDEAVRVDARAGSQLALSTLFVDGVLFGRGSRFVIGLAEGWAYLVSARHVLFSTERGKQLAECVQKLCTD